MTLTQLRYLRLIHRTGSLRRAAAALHVSQPAVTSAMNALEAELDQPLLQRRGNQTVLTEAGMRVLQTAELFAKEEERLRQDLSDMTRQKGVRIRLAVCLYAPLPLDAVRTFSASHPRTQVVMDQCSALHVVQALDDEECDLGILYTEMLNARTGSRPLGTQEFGVFCPPGHPFLRLACVPQDDVLGEISRQNAAGKNAEADSGLFLSSRTLSGVFSLSLDPMLAALQARLNRKIAVLPLLFSDERGGLAARPLDPPLAVPLSLAWNTRHFLTRDAQDLLGVLTASPDP